MINKRTVTIILMIAGLFVLINFGWQLTNTVINTAIDLNGRL